MIRLDDICYYFSIYPTLSLFLCSYFLSSFQWTIFKIPFFLFFYHFNSTSLCFLLITIEIILAILCYYSLSLNNISPSHNVKTVNFIISSIPLSSFVLSYINLPVLLPKILKYCFKQCRHVYTNTYEYIHICVCVYT